MTRPDITITGSVSKGYTPPSSNVRTTLEVVASFCPIRAYPDGMSFDYSRELMTVAPFAPLEDGCLVVLAMDSHLTVAKWGKGRGGRYHLTFGSGDRASHTKNDLGDGYSIIGRVVGPDRVFPRMDVAPASSHAD